MNTSPAKFKALSVVLAFTLNTQVALAKDETEESHGCKEVQKIFKGKYKCKEVGDFHDSPGLQTKVTPTKVKEKPKKDSPKLNLEKNSSVKESSDSKEKNEVKK